MVLQEARSDLRDHQAHRSGSVSVVNNCSIVKLGKMAANINEANIPATSTSPALISNGLMKFLLPGRLHLLMAMKNIIMPVF